MSDCAMTVTRKAFATGCVLGMLVSAAWAGDLSRYRAFQLGTDLATVARQTGRDPSQAKTVHLRPALIQELTWRPQLFSSPSQSDPVQEVVFSFYGGELFQIAVKYDRYEIQGLTSEDIIDAISRDYGKAERPAPAGKSIQEPYGDQDQIVARWESPQYRFDLVRTPYGPGFELTGVLKRLEAPVQAAVLEARRLDDQEAPERDAARKSSDEAAARATLEKYRLANKPKFRP